MKNRILLAIGITAGLHAFAQPSLNKLAENIKRQRQESEFALKLTSSTQGALQLSSRSRLSTTVAKAWLYQSLGLRSGKDDLLKAPGGSRFAGDIQIEKYQQYYGGVKVEHGFTNVVSRGGKVDAVQLEFYPLDDNFSTTPRLSEAEALGKATAYVGASRYAWEGYSGSDPERQKPAGTLVIVEDYYGKRGRLNLAYKFEIYAEKPLSRSFVYVSATNGNVLLVDRIIKHLSPGMDGRQEYAAPQTPASPEQKPFANTTGNAQTRYSGTQNIVADNGGTTTGKPYVLRQVRNNHNIITLNYERRVRSAANDALAIDFSDNDNDWTATEYGTNYDDAALDVHHALQWVSDYWKNVHNRNSWDNGGAPMKSYVHVRADSDPAIGYDNAFWSGSAMYYGDGSYYSADGAGAVSNSRGFKPLASIDVSAHELGHAVCQSTAQLVYQRESGGMNEGFSDIWAACVENYSGLPKSPFLIGEEIVAPGTGGALRSMQKPKLFGNPDTYGGQYWIRTSLSSCAIPGSGNDQCGVHYNSGVLNKWFYLITAGSTGTNDNGDTYNISGLGFSKSEKIAFLLEQSLTPNADYAAARVASINAATALYGACSNEVVQVTNAWFAVGVGTSANCNPVVEFVKTASTVTEGNGLAGSATDTKIVSIPVKLGAAATQKTDLQFSFGGTAVPGVHYTVASSTVSFAAGESGIKNCDLLIIDNATVEANRTITLSFTVTANGGNAAPGVNNQAYTLTINDDDVLPLPVKATPVSTVTLVNEDFETSAAGTVFPAGWNSTLAPASGASTENIWSIGPNAGTGINGYAAYISNTSATTLDYAYGTTSATDRLLRLPALNTTGLTDLRLQFKYKVGGEVDPIDPANPDPGYYAALWDYGRIMYDATGAGTTFSTLFDGAAADYVVLSGAGTTAQTFAPFRLPASMENKSAVHLAFRWINDEYAGNGLPLAVDDIMVTGRTMGTSIEGAINRSNTVRVLAGTADTYIASAGGANLLAKLSNVSETISSLAASLEEAGSSRATINTSAGSFFRSQKIIRLTPSVPNATATYNASFYFTVAELANWSASEIPQLKILKVKDGADLNGTLSPGDAQLVTPVFTDNSSNGYYTYTAGFTGFSRFMLVSPGFTLPANLLTFDVQPSKKSLDLSWTTAGEYNNRGFDVQRSTNGRDFSSIGWVAANGTGAASYRFSDRFVQPNTFYQYRLRQVGFDNEARFSAVRQGSFSQEKVSVTVSPNPARNMVKVFATGTTQLATVSLLDAKGQEVAQWQKLPVGAGCQLDLGRFGRGAYSVVVHLPSGNHSVQVILQ